MATKIIIFDLETSGFRRDDDILQISALYLCKNWIFNNYITPSRPVSREASRVNGLVASGNNLFLHGDRVNTVSAARAIKSFIHFLGRIKGPVILLAHNCFSFDCPRLLRLVSAVGMLAPFKRVVQGFADSLPIFKEEYPLLARKRRRFSMKALAARFLDDFDFGSLHNAVNDVKTLSELITAMNIDRNTIIKNSRNILTILEQMKKRDIIRANRNSLSEYEETMSNYILMKMAKNGINKKILLDTFDEKGYNGIIRLFTENVDGKPRVTKNRRIVHRFLNYYF